MNVKEAVEHFKLLEQQYWKNLSRETVDYLTDNGVLQPEDMLLYGEFAFALLNLKHNVIIDFRDPKENENFFASVVLPVLDACAEKTLKYHTVKHHLSHEKSFKGSILLYNVNKPVKAVELLLSDETQFIKENTLATILDYPGTLPATEKDFETMKTVVYYHDSPEGLVALTTFIIQESEKKYTMAHFMHYATTCKENLDMQLKLLID